MSQASYSVKHSRDAGLIGRVLARFGAKHFVAVFAATLLLTALFWPSESELALEANPVADKDFELALQGNSRVELPLEVVDDAHAVLESTDIPWQSFALKRGDSMASAFKKVGLSPVDLHNIMQNKDAASVLSKVMPGREVQYQVDENNNLTSLRYPIDHLSTLEIERSDLGYQANTLTKAVAVRTNFASGTIESSLFADGQKAGLSDAVIMQLAGIFGYDIDFALDLRGGDRFTVVYEERLVEGMPAGAGNILAAEFVNAGKSFQAVRYEDSTGKASYYTPDGMSMRKAFLRMPLPFARVSSSFNLARKHPILNKIRAHKGVDYAAPSGTPVYASGDGKVSFVGTKGGYGRLVAIQHGGSYTTHYAHLSRYGKGIRTGARVRQGEVIGYVGASGLATAPHLHYEFLVNGVFRNPRTVPLPQAEPIAPQEKARFVQSTAPVLATLEAHSRVLLASTP